MVLIHLLTVFNTTFLYNVLLFTVFMIRNKDPKKSEKWRIIVDEGLLKIESFPHFFHGDYCVPQVSGTVDYKVYITIKNLCFYTLIIWFVYVCILA